MVRIKDKTPKQYNRDYYERHGAELREKRKQRYWEERKNKVTIVNVDNLTIRAKNVTIIDEDN